MQNFWRNRNVAITGSRGFIGSALLSRLFSYGARLLPLGDADILFHLAGFTNAPLGNKQPMQCFEGNITRTCELLEQIRQYRVPAVIASTDKAYGDAPTPYTEQTPLLALQPYAASKACMDMIARTYAATYGLPITVTRCGNFFGPDRNHERIVPSTILAVLAGNRPVIRSDGSMVRDYGYVQNGIDAYLLLGQMLLEEPAKVQGQAFNIGHDNPMTVLKLLNTVLDLMGSDLEPEIQNRVSNEIKVQTLDSSRFKALTGWKPAVSLEEGLMKTIKHYEKRTVREPEGVLV